MVVCSIQTLLLKQVMHSPSKQEKDQHNALNMEMAGRQFDLWLCSTVNMGMTQCSYKA